MSILSRKIYAACSSEIFLSEILVENQNCTISVGIFSVYISKGFIPFRNRVIPNATHWSRIKMELDNSFLEVKSKTQTCLKMRCKGTENVLPFLA